MAYLYKRVISMLKRERKENSISQIAVHGGLLGLRYYDTKQSVYINLGTYFSTSFLSNSNSAAFQLQTGKREKTGHFGNTDFMISLKKTKNFGLTVCVCACIVKSIN